MHNRHLSIITADSLFDPDKLGRNPFRGFENEEDFRDYYVPEIIRRNQRSNFLRARLRVIRGFIEDGEFLGVKSLRRTVDRKKQAEILSSLKERR
jgi:hypothetical protein